MQLVQNNLLTTLHILGKEWRVTHDFKPTEYVDYWTNSLQLTIGGNGGVYGFRTPLFNPSTPTPGKMSVAFAVNGDENYRLNFDQPPVGAWSTIAHQLSGYPLLKTPNFGVSDLSTNWS